MSSNVLFFISFLQRTVLLMAFVGKHENYLLLHEENENELHFRGTNGLFEYFVLLFWLQ